MLFVLAASVVWAVSARILNMTIDDTLGDERTGKLPQYEPDWIPRSVGGAPCTGCGAQPDGSLAFKGTWHDRSTYVKDPPCTISLDFSGSRIYVFFILHNNLGTVNKNTRVRFFLDSSVNSAGDYVHVSDRAGVHYLYNQLVFDSTTLEFGNHNLLISSYSNGTDGSLALFDYAVYTTDDDPIPHTTQTAGPTPSQREGDGHSPRVGVAIGGSIAGGLVAAILLGVAYWIYTRRGRTNRPPSALGSVTDSYTQAATVEPFDARRPSRSDATSLERGYRERTSKALLVSQPSLRSAEDSAQLRTELGWVREELERVRRIAEPPDYSRTSSNRHMS
ncbi:hypothetical protein AURDEDRAFT_175142 [Auricularia subglabra TFB-10046 SS5]|nr:hypothetical protein AURDEDRAFT_175142 [Auricularia subglabra TFB-10046 SS5]